MQRVGIGVQSLGLFSSEVEWFAELVPGVHDVSVLGVEDLHRELCTGFQAFDPVLDAAGWAG